MTPAEVRDAMIDALRRDLRGPLVDPTGGYPGVRPRLVTRGQIFASPDEVTGPLVAEDGQEVVREFPAARYPVGVLLPPGGSSPRPGASAEAPGAVDEPAEETARPQPPDIARGSVVDSLTATEAVESRMSDPTGGRARSRAGVSIGFSVLLRPEAPLDTITLTVRGAAYHRFPLTAAGQPVRAWHRVEVCEAVSIDTSGTGAARTVRVAGLTLTVGIHARRASADGRVVTCYLVNQTAASSPEDVTERILFSAQLSADVPDAAVGNYPDRASDRSAEASSLGLLYARHRTRVVGHGTDAVVDPVGDRTVVRTESFPVARIRPTSPDVADGVGPLAIDMESLAAFEPDAVATVDRLIASYRAQIAGWDTAAPASADPLTARRHVAACRAFADDVAAGWELVQTRAEVRQCFSWMGSAMAAQRRSYAAPTRAATWRPESETVTVAGAEPQRSSRRSSWRPFQLAFILANIGPTVDPSHARRGVVDVIWMPTGGGKTEAYLGLAGFTMLHRRLAGRDLGRDRGRCGRGTSVVMRYTLRLLTAQQFQRAASLICALELLRKADPRLGRQRFSIGAWLGKAVTPNLRDEAVKQLHRFAADDSGRLNEPKPFLLTRCPRCATEMGRRVRPRRVLGYAPGPLPSGGGQRLVATCPNPLCEFSARGSAGPLPVYEVDEDVYAAQPTFVVATVDKFAQLAWTPRPRSLFGIGADGDRCHPPPDLVIQDELHLIAGPLGSLVALYESAVSELCRHDGGAAPHVVAATATTRAYQRQAEMLYDCPREHVRLVPPPGLDIEDSFFARVDPDTTPRAFVGVCAPGGPPLASLEMRVVAGLAHAAAALDQLGEAVDPYWTNVAFFGSLRDLGQAKALLSLDQRRFAWRLVQQTGIRSGSLDAHGKRRAVRTLGDAELTGASSGDAAAALAQLAVPKGQDECIDLALATSVIEVGVDVDRLGLLTVVRQPKASSQYIQVSGRVGRDTARAPGIVVTLLNPGTARDLSHFERFTDEHHRLYASVEPASITPFTAATLQRGLRGTLASVIRQTRPDAGGAVTADDETALWSFVGHLADRSNRVTRTSTAGDQLRWAAQGAADELLQAVDQRLPWGGYRFASGPALLLSPDRPPPADRPCWSTLTSLRSVDSDAALRISDRFLPINERVKSAQAARPADENGGEW